MRGATRWAAYPQHLMVGGSLRKWGCRYHATTEMGGWVPGRRKWCISHCIVGRVHVRGVG
eukprot:753936-Hanusia_phi.AAC.8